MIRRFYTVAVLMLAVTSVFALDTALVEKTILQLVNKERSMQSLMLLKNDEKLADVAKTHANSMVEAKKLSHVGKDEMSPAQRVRAGYPELLFGVFENIATSNAETEDEVASSIVKAWMESDGHKSNILNTNVNYSGIGVAEGENGIFYVTHILTESVAKLVAGLGTTPVAKDSKLRLTFDFLGNFPKDDLVVFAKFPDSEARFMIDSTSYYTGCGVFTPDWSDNTFQIVVDCKYGTGKYELYMGKDKKYYGEPVVFEVK